MTIPTFYEAGYRRMKGADPDRARRYVEHLTIGDPLADAAVEAIAPLSEGARQHLIRAGMDGDEGVLRRAPRALIEFFEASRAAPSWWDPDALGPGYRGFDRYSDVLALVFIVGSGVEGFRSLIAKTFFTTGRMIDFGVRRAQQNTWHLLAIMTPGGLDPGADGWKLSLRIRLVHAQVRQQMREWDGWDAGDEGMPISAAHLGLAAAIFSARCIEFGARLGARLTREEREGIMGVWRYTAHLLGVPDPVLFRDYEDALEICRVGLGCEPEVGIEQIAMANALINSIPLLGGFTEPKARMKYATKLYRVSRALLGDEVADSLRFPPQRTFGLLRVLTWRRRFDGLRSRATAWLAGKPPQSHAQMLFDLVRPDKMRMSYRLPPQLYSDDRVRW